MIMSVCDGLVSARRAMRNMRCALVAIPSVCCHTIGMRGYIHMIYLLCTTSLPFCETLIIMLFIFFFMTLRCWFPCSLDGSNNSLAIGLMQLVYDTNW